MFCITMKHEVPAGSRVFFNTSRDANYVDCFRVALPLNEKLSVDYLFARFCSAVPRWVITLLSLRNVLVTIFGLKTGSLPLAASVEKDIYFEPHSGDCLFTVIHRTEDELVMGESDQHLDFRLSAKISEVPNVTTILELTTVVWYNNWLGPIYFGIVQFFHRAIMKNMLNRAARNLEAEFGMPSVMLTTPQHHHRTWLIRWVVFLLSSLCGVLFTAMGIMHFPLAFRLAKLPSYAALSPAALDFFVLLCLCVGLLLLLVGGLSFYFSHRLRYHDIAACVFFLAVGLTSFGRILLDVLYPLTVLGETASPFIDTLVVLLVTILPVVLTRRLRESENFTLTP